ncbi:hypothetical protein RchiOBHm_Chr7g0201101 [Rosa chinensis]|uniref:Uncharacterized protein n=1 Tax=Rosa chinensis TaxID=74649 RepID=A0A2P6P7U5_ROSCH|nr:hypothetical protein RchiOBHm_Chr7g0201101 [Rosa chinensis]
MSLSLEREEDDWCLVFGQLVQYVQVLFHTDPVLVVGSFSPILTSPKFSIMSNSNDPWSSGNKNKKWYEGISNSGGRGGGNPLPPPPPELLIPSNQFLFLFPDAQDRCSCSS